MPKCLNCGEFHDTLENVCPKCIAYAQDLISKYEPFKLGLYRHFKGQMYRVTDIAEHSETGEKYVIYKAMYGEYKIYIRPFKTFNEMVEKDGKVVKRFTHISLSQD